MPINFLKSRAVAFTLIELLIVVAIIAILASIAVPNFLEAQVRAKVVRTKADMRTTAYGLEAYVIDHVKYPEEQPVTANGYLSTISLSRLTSPVSYLNSLACVVDIFNKTENVNTTVPGLEKGQPFLYANYEQFGQNRPLGPFKMKAWGLCSFGPDKRNGNGTSNSTGLFGPWAEGNDSAYFNNANGFGTARSLILDIYDPTNGTISTGDIYLVGGACPSRSRSIMNDR